MRVFFLRLFKRLCFLLPHMWSPSNLTSPHQERIRAHCSGFHPLIPLNPSSEAALKVLFQEYLLQFKDFWKLAWKEYLVSSHTMCSSGATLWVLFQEEFKDFRKFKRPYTIPSSPKHAAPQQQSQIPYYYHNCTPHSILFKAFCLAMCSSTATLWVFFQEQFKDFRKFKRWQLW